MQDINLGQDVAESHWQLGLLQYLDVGLVVLDKNYTVQLWNSFMSNHSGFGPLAVRDKSLFEVFPELPANWLKRKIDSVFQLECPTYVNWEQRPYLFPFHSHRPITESVPLMYQNITLIPLTSPSGEVENVGILVYDVTDVAVKSAALNRANDELLELSREDRLTGLYNRGYWEECLERELTRFQRTQQPTSLILLDIDHFKLVN
ncbi:MAG: diguanylate cyclase, partial [Pontibacterium sp.]